MYKDVSQGLPAQHALRIESYLPGMIGPMNFVNLANFFVQVCKRCIKVKGRGVWVCCVCL